jgi:hypothetical protein
VRNSDRNRGPRISAGELRSRVQLGFGRPSLLLRQGNWKWLTRGRRYLKAPAVPL